MKFRIIIIRNAFLLLFPKYSVAEGHNGKKIFRCIIWIVLVYSDEYKTSKNYFFVKGSKMVKNIFEVCTI